MYQKYIDNLSRTDIFKSSVTGKVEILPHGMVPEGEDWNRVCSVGDLYEWKYNKLPIRSLTTKEIRDLCFRARSCISTLRMLLLKQNE
jgi:hypothetical protein